MTSYVWTFFLIFLLLVTYFIIKERLRRKNCEMHETSSAQNGRHPAPTTHVTVAVPPSTPPPNQIDHGMIFPGILHSEAQLNPPPYTVAVALVLPPSYDEAIKQNTQENSARPANSSSEENKY